MAWEPLKTFSSFSSWEPQIAFWELLARPKPNSKPRPKPKHFLSKFCALTANLRGSFSRCFVLQNLLNLVQFCVLEHFRTDSLRIYSGILRFPLSHPGWSRYFSKEAESLSNSNRNNSDPFCSFPVLLRRRQATKTKNGWKLIKAGSQPEKMV